jgi:hypothetical protein
MWSDPDVVAMVRWCAEAVSLFLLLGTAFLLLRHWSGLPVRVPAHFDFRGLPDRWSGRWILWVLLGVMGALFVGMSVSADTLGLLEGRAPASARQAVNLTWVKMNTLAMLAYAMWTMVRVARGTIARMNVRLIVMLAAIMILPMYLMKGE